MGIATRAETEFATDVARNISGVRKVVRMVEIISDQELANLKAQQPLTASDGSGSSSSSSSSSSHVPLPPMEPLPASPSSSPAAPPANTGVVATPVR
jgi:hypothetical protein